MRRTILACAGVLLSVVALGSDSPKEYDDATEGIEGTWRLVGRYYQGKSYVQNQMALTFSSGSYTADHYDYKLRGRYRIGAVRQQPYLDKIESSGNTFMYIYRIEDNTLWLASIINAGSEKRPTGFDDNVVIEIYKRVK